jgi:two-component system, repressor protein LuxO
MPLTLQRRLLPVLQRDAGPFGRGPQRSGPVRLVAGCAEPPQVALAQGRLDPGLFHLLDTLRIDLPPLRDRGRDVVEIARAALNHFGAETGKSFQGLSAPVEELLSQLPWPGNVAELLKLIRQVVLVQPGGLVTLDMLPDALVPSVLRGVEQGAAPAPTAPAATPRPTEPAPSRAAAIQALRGLTLAEVERAVIEDVIAAEDGSLPRAARALGLSPSTLYRKREAWTDKPD